MDLTDGCGCKGLRLKMLKDLLRIATQFSLYNRSNQCFIYRWNRILSLGHYLGKFFRQKPLIHAHALSDLQSGSPEIGEFLKDLFGIFGVEIIIRITIRLTGLLFQITLGVVGSNLDTCFGNSTSTLKF